MKKLIILILSISIISLTSCNKAKSLEVKNNSSSDKIIVENPNKYLKEDTEIIEELTVEDNTNIDNITSLDDEKTIENDTSIEDSTIIKNEISNKDALPIKNDVVIENNQSNPENIINENLQEPNRFTPVKEEDAINYKTDNTIYFFISNSNADGFDIIEKNVGTSNLKEVLDLAVNEYSLGSIPKGTVVNSAYVENGTAYINLNEFFATDSQSSSSAYTYTKIYSIVNLSIYNKVFGVDKVVLSIEDGTIPYIGQIIIPEFYTAKLFNKGTY